MAFTTKCFVRVKTRCVRSSIYANQQTLYLPHSIGEEKRTAEEGEERTASRCACECVHVTEKLWRNQTAVNLISCYNWRFVEKAYRKFSQNNVRNISS